MTQLRPKVYVIPALLSEDMYRLHIKPFGTYTLINKDILDKVLGISMHIEEPTEIIITLAEVDEPKRGK